MKLTSVSNTCTYTSFLSTFFHYYIESGTTEMESFSNGILCVIFTTCTYGYTVDIQFTCQDTEISVELMLVAESSSTTGRPTAREKGERWDIDHQAQERRERGVCVYGGGGGGDKIRCKNSLVPRHFL